MSNIKLNYWSYIAMRECIELSKHVSIGSLKNVT